MLTKNILLSMPHNTIFAIGSALAVMPGIYREIVTWVAAKKGIDGWAIYYECRRASFVSIIETGVKISEENIIKNLVPCDDEAYALYRR